MWRRPPSPFSVGGDLSSDPRGGAERGGGLRRQLRGIGIVALSGLALVACGSSGGSGKLAAQPTPSVSFASVAAGVTAAVNQRSCARLKAVPGLVFPSGELSDPCQVLSILESMRPQSSRQLGPIGLISGTPAHGGPPQGQARVATFTAIFAIRPDRHWFLAMPPYPAPLPAPSETSSRSHAEQFATGIRSHECDRFYSSLNHVSPTWFAANGRTQSKQQLCSQEPFVGATRVLLANGPAPRLDYLGSAYGTGFVGVAAAHGYLTIIVGRAFPSIAAPGGGSPGHPPSGPPPGAQTQPPRASAPGVIGFVRNS